MENIMTQEEKLIEAKKLYETANADQRYLLESLFPEILEDEDERIRREIVRFLSIHKNDERKIDDWIVWLNKKGV